MSFIALPENQRDTAKTENQTLHKYMIQIRFIFSNQVIAAHYQHFGLHLLRKCFCATECCSCHSFSGVHSAICIYSGSDFLRHQLIMYSAPGLLQVVPSRAYSASEAKLLGAVQLQNKITELKKEIINMVILIIKYLLGLLLKNEMIHISYYIIIYKLTSNYYYIRKQLATKRRQSDKTHKINIAFQMKKRVRAR